MYMPLESLINKLKQNGFSIRPDDYIEILKVIERFQPATLQEAGNLICPLIVNSPEEQERFGIVFRKICAEDNSIDTEKQKAWWKHFSKKSWRWIIGVIAGAAILSGIIIFAIHIVIPPANRVALEPVISISDTNGGAYRIGDTLGFDVHQSFKEPSDTNRVDWEWNFGKGWGNRNEKYVTVVAKETGDQQAQLRFVDAKDRVVADTGLVYKICPVIPEPGLIANRKTLITTDDTLQINADIPEVDLKGYNTLWLVNDDTLAKNTTSIEYSPDTAGSYRIYFMILSPDGVSNCDYAAIESYIVDDLTKTDYAIIATPGGDILQQPRKLKSWTIFLAGALLILACISALLLHLLDKKRKKRAKNILESATASTVERTVKKPPYEIPLENRQHQLIASEQAMNDVMRFMHQRTRDEALALNIPQTVRNTIRTGGVPDLVYSNKLRPNDYIIVIDSRVVNSQQVKLFEYLVATFCNENMSVVQFHYKDNFSTFYNRQYPAGLSFKRLTELYKEYTLIIYGTAHHLIYDAYPTINADRFNELSDWENKAVLTPIAYQDWGIHEKLISSQMILLPADAEGQLRLIKAINEKLLRHDDYLSSADHFYTTTLYDFTETSDIKEYLKDDDLFQWVCALAIYPGVRWEVLIELGKAVLQRRDCAEKMNYTNLLKLVRMNWLHEGYFPEQTRLELLKQLGVSEELAARKRLIEMFEYADMYFKDDHYFSDEKKMQEITNKFVVYANDPIHHEAYLPAKEQFEVLWRNNKITDAPLKKYIDNAGKRKWDTPLQQQDKTIPASDYFQTEGSFKPPPPSLQKWSNILRGAAGLFAILFAGLLIWGDDLAETKLGRLQFIGQADTARVIPITIEHGDMGYCLSGLNDSLDFDALQLVVRDQALNIIPVKDTSGNKLTYAISYGTLLRPLYLEAYWNVTLPSRLIDPKSRSGMAATYLSFDSDAVRIRISGCKTDSSQLVTVRYADSSQLSQVNDLLSKFVAIGYRVDAQTGPLTDSFKVKYYNYEDESKALQLAQDATALFGKIYSPFYATDASINGSSFEIIMGHTQTTGTNTGTCNTIPIDKLPGSLTEIWKGGRSNRLITIHLSRKRIIYSTGDKNTYGTYTIEQVCLRGDTYKIITSANGQYKNFFVRNVGNERFDLSVCQNMLPSLAAATADTGDCNNYDAMRLYYENPSTNSIASQSGPQKISAFHLPYSGSRLHSSESARLATFLNMLKDQGVMTADLNMVFNSALPTSRTSQAYLGDFKNYFTAQLARVGMQAGRSGYTNNNRTPFDRNYFWLVEPNATPGGSAGMDTTWQTNALRPGCGELIKGIWEVNGYKECLGAPITYVPDVTLPANRYVLEWEIRVLGSTPADSILVQVEVMDMTANNRVLAKRDLYEKDFLVRSPFPKITLPFTITPALANHRLELRVYRKARVSVNTGQVRVFSSPMRGDQ